MVKAAAKGLKPALEDRRWNGRRGWLEGKWDVNFRKGMVEAKAGSRGGPGRRHRMTECQGNPASTPKVSPTYRPTAKWMAACWRQGYGHAGFEGGSGVEWQRMACLCSP